MRIFPRRKQVAPPTEPSRHGLLTKEQIAREREDMKFFVECLKHFLSELQYARNFREEDQPVLIENTIGIFYREVRSNPLFERYSSIAISPDHVLRAGRIIPNTEGPQATDSYLPWVDVQLLLSLFDENPTRPQTR